MSKRKYTKATPFEGQGTLALSEDRFFCSICQRGFERFYSFNWHNNDVHDRMSASDIETTHGQPTPSNVFVSEDPYNSDEEELSDDERSEDERPDAKEQQDFQLMESTFQLILQHMENANDNVEGGVETLQSALNKRAVWNNITTDFHLFRDLQTMVMIALVDGDNDMLSGRILNKILFAMNLLIKLSNEAARDNRVFRLPPRPDAILNYLLRLRNKLPAFPSKEVC